MSCLEEAIEGFEAAGFVNVGGEQRDVGGMLEIAVFGDCPCGLGRSAMAMRVRPDALLPVGYVCERFKRFGLEHIEQDRREGRWA